MSSSSLHLDSLGFGVLPSASIVNADMFRLAGVAYGVATIWSNVGGVEVVHGA